MCIQNLNLLSNKDDNIKSIYLAHTICQACFKCFICAHVITEYNCKEETVIVLIFIAEKPEAQRKSLRTFYQIVQNNCLSPEPMLLTIFPKAIKFLYCILMIQY